MNLALRGATTVQVPVRLPGVDIAAGRLGVRAGRVQLRPAPPGRVGFRTELQLMDGRRAVATLILDAEVAPRVDPQRHTVSVGLGPQNLRAVEPRMDPAARRSLAAFLHRQLPPAAKMLVSRGDIEQATATLASELVRRSWPQLRDSVLADVGEVTQLTFAFPEIPLRAVDIRSRAGALDLLVDTGLPVDAGVSRPSPSDAVDPNFVVLRASGSAVAALGNAALATGRLPARYDLAGAPDPQGPFVVGLGWVPGPRPLRLHAWAETGDCAYLRISGTPQLRVRGDALEVRVDDGRIDEARGPTKLRLAAFSQRVGRDALVFVHQETARFDLDLGGRALRAQVIDVSTTAEGLRTRLSIAPVR